MYKTKVFCDRARDHFSSKTPFLAEKEKYKEADLGKGPRYKGKQFQTAPPKNTSGGVGYFNKFTYKGEAYKDTNGYLTKQPLESRKRGFGSHDCKKRDQFTLHIETERYRELLKFEKKFNAKVMAQSADKIKSAYDRTRRAKSAGATRSRADFVTTVPKKLYDVGRKSETPVCLKCHRDTFFCKHRLGGINYERNLGEYKLASQDIGYALPPEPPKPKFGSVHATKEFHFDGHL